MSNIFQPIHKHLLIKCEVNRVITSEKESKIFLSTMVKRIGMKAVTWPQCAYVADLGNEGYTGSINLATSHIAYHIWDTTKLMMLDVYSCKEFDKEVIFSYIIKERKAVNIEFLEIDREHLANYQRGNV